MATVKQWEDAVKELDADEVGKISLAIDTLLDWDFFHEQFKGQGIDTIGAVTDYIYIDKKLGKWRV